MIGFAEIVLQYKAIELTMRAKVPAKMAINDASRYFRILVSVALLLFGVPVNGQTPATSSLDWREFKSEAGGFSIKFPGAPTIQELSLQKGPVTLTRHAHALSLEDFVFHVEYVDYPKGYNDPSLSMEGGISGFKHAIQNDGGSVLSESTLTRGNCEGREATFLFRPKRANHSEFSQGRIFVSGERFYLMMFATENDSPAAREVGRTFMDSFSVTGGCTSLIAPTAAPSGPAKVEVVEGSPDPSGWRRINSTLGFSMLMPGAATHETEQSQVDPFPITHHTFIYESESSIFSLEVFGEYPRDFRSNEVHYQTALDLTLYTVKKNLEPAGFKIASLRELRLARFPGREFSLSHQDLGTGRMQIYVTPTYIYVVIAVVNNSPTAAGVVDRFFASLRISPK